MAIKYFIKIIKQNRWITHALDYYTTYLKNNFSVSCYIKNVFSTVFFLSNVLPIDSFDMNIVTQ